MSSKIATLAAFAMSLFACAEGSAPTNSAPVVQLDSGHSVDSGLPSLGAVDHSCDYQLNGYICNDMINVDHYDAPDVVLAQYSILCKKPEIANNMDECMVWALRGERGNQLGYPEFWAYCCVPPTSNLK